MPDTTIKPNGWNEWAHFVLTALRDLKSQVEKLDDKIDDQKTDFLKAVNELEKAILQERSDRAQEISQMSQEIITKQLDERRIPTRKETLAWSSIIPGIAAAFLLIYEFILKR